MAHTQNIALLLTQLQRLLEKGKKIFVSNLAKDLQEKIHHQEKLKERHMYS